MNNGQSVQFKMKKLLARCVPRVFTIDQNQNRSIPSECGLEIYKCNLGKFVSRLITTDETWLNHNIPESRQQAAQ